MTVEEAIDEERDEKEEKKRVQLDLALQTIRDIDTLKSTMGVASRADVIRFSLELLKFGYKAKKDGMRLGVRNADGTMEFPLLPGANGL